MDHDAHPYEHSRRQAGAIPSRSWNVIGPRLLRPLVGGAVGAAIIVLFLAIRGGQAVELNELTGTAWGGWSRHADVHLLIVVNVAVVVAIAVNFAAEWVHRWLELAVLVVIAGILIALRQLAGVDGAGGNILLGLISFFLASALALAAHDLRRTPHRSGY